MAGSWRARWRRPRAGSLTDEEAEAIDRRSGELFDERNRDPQPLPGARELLRALDERGLTWAIATSSRREQVTASIAALGLDHEPRIVDGSHVERAKPAPDLLLLGARELGVAPGGLLVRGRLDLGHAGRERGGDGRHRRAGRRRGR